MGFRFASYGEAKFVRFHPAHLVDNPRNHRATMLGDCTAYDSLDRVRRAVKPRQNRRGLDGAVARRNASSLTRPKMSIP